MQMVWKRVQRLVTAKAHGRVDQMERPTEMLNQALREQASALTEGKVGLRRLQAWQRRLARSIATEESRVAEMGMTARDAVRDGKDEIARWALQRRRDAEDRIRVCSEQKTRSEEMIAAQTARVDKLQANLIALRDKRGQLVQRERFAESLRAMAPPAIDHEPIEALVDRMEEKVVEMETEAEVIGETILDVSTDEHDAVRGYLRDREIEEDLARLKAETVAES